MYANIIFIQDSEASEYFDMLGTYGEDYLIDYLTNWDYGEYYDTSETCMCGTSDFKYERGDYILCVNYALEYIGLTKKI